MISRMGPGISGTLGRLIAIALALAGLVAVAWIMWEQISNAWSDINGTDSLKEITSEVVCEAAGGTWTVTSTPKCARL